MIRSASLVATLLILLGTTACGGDDAGDSGDPDATGGRATGTGGGGPGSGGSDSGTGGTVVVDPDSGFGETYAGTYHLGPVDWEESAWHNACAPYTSELQELEGDILAGLQTGKMDGSRLCDSCVIITAGETSIVARVVTYGDTGPNDIDLSPAACAALSGDAGCDVWPRDMSWQFAMCPDTGNIAYQFQTEANEWWTSFWVRNSRLPITKVEVQSTNHPSFTELPIGGGGDGTITDGGGFGAGEFTLRVTSVDGQVITDTFPSFAPGGTLWSTTNFE